jgi:HD-like signal output (HDOD) protein
MAEEMVTPEEYRGHVSPGKNWKEIVAWVSDLPPLPHVAAQAIALIEDPNISANKLTDLLGKDPALAARVLKIANSAMFSCQREITTLNQAIMVIGFKALKGIIVAATLRQLNRKFGPTEKMIWENSTCTAAGCQILSKHLKKNYADETFLLGLLHDLGKIVLVRQMPAEYEKVVGETKQGRWFHEVEQNAFGFGHQLIGALVAKKWNFSHETCQAILHHHDPVEMPFKTPLDEKTALIQTADLFAHAAGYGHQEGYPEVQAPMIESAAKFGIDEETANKLVEQVKEVYAASSSVL